MIPKEELIKDIEKFQKQFEIVCRQCDRSTGPGNCHLLYFKMTEAWRELSNTIEFKLKPLIEETKEHGA